MQPNSHCVFQDTNCIVRMDNHRGQSSCRFMHLRVLLTSNVRSDGKAQHGVTRNGDILISAGRAVAKNNAKNDAAKTVEDRKEKVLT